MNKSAKIRELYDAGLSIMDISKLLGVRYQFAYNVISHHSVVKELEVLKNAARTNSDNGLPVEHK